MKSSETSGMLYDTVAEITSQPSLIPKERIPKLRAVMDSLFIYFIFQLNRPIPTRKCRKEKLTASRDGAVLYQINPSSPPPQKSRKSFAGKEASLWINANYVFLF